MPGAWHGRRSRAILPPSDAHVPDPHPLAVERRLAGGGSARPARLPPPVRPGRCAGQPRPAPTRKRIARSATAPRAPGASRRSKHESGRASLRPRRIDLGGSYDGFPNRSLCIWPSLLPARSCASPRSPSPRCCLRPGRPARAAAAPRRRPRPAARRALAIRANLVFTVRTAARWRWPSSTGYRTGGASGPYLCLACAAPAAKANGGSAWAAPNRRGGRPRAIDARRQDDPQDAVAPG